MHAALATIEARRECVAQATTASHKSKFGQFMTPNPIGVFMAGLFSPLTGKDIRLLDAGAGVGSLTAAFTYAAAAQGATRVVATTWELDESIVPHLHETLDELSAYWPKFTGSINANDFVLQACQDIQTSKGLFADTTNTYTHAILNPPYKKLPSKSEHWQALRETGIEVSNLYSAFVALALMRLEEGGELVAITPRSFCNGTYFRPFRRLLLKHAAIRRVHIFRSRTSAFKSDEVLQENVIFHLTKGAQQGAVIISESSDSSFSDVTERIVPFAEVILPDDKEVLIHLVSGDDGVAQNQMACFPNSLNDIGLDVSTGPVVDFRLRDHLSDVPQSTSVPLIYPLHFERGAIEHPREGAKKANWINVNAETSKWLMPSGYYTLVRRLSSKEEKRRLVPAVFDPTNILGELIGFENHLNVFHAKKRGMKPEIARGLMVWLGSTVADEWLRRFNGHTQVNAGDLRALGYPDLDTLAKWGKAASGRQLSQMEIDALVAEAMTS